MVTEGGRSQREVGKEEGEDHGAKEEGERNRILDRWRTELSIYGLGPVIKRKKSKISNFA